MTWLALFVSVAALVVSIATYRRAGASLRREKVLRLEQRKQAASVSALTNELTLIRSLEKILVAKSNQPDHDARLEEIRSVIQEQIEDLQRLKKTIDELDPFRIKTDEAEVLLEKVIGQLTGLQERTKKLQDNVGAVIKVLEN